MTKLSKNNQKIFTILILAALILPGLTYFSSTRRQKNQAQNGQNSNLGQEIEVKVVKVARQKTNQTLELSGKVAAQKISEIRPQISGVIRKITFTEGSFVKKGKQLYQIDSEIYESALNSAKRNLAALQAKKSRYQKLLEIDAISKQEFEDVAAALAAANSDFSSAKKNLEYTKVLSPISGYAGKSNFTEGALVALNQSDPLTTITQLDPIYVEFELPTQDFASIKSNEKGAVNLIGDEQLSQIIGKIQFSEMIIDQSTDSVLLRAIFPNKNQYLLPGMFVKAQINLNSIDSLIVPQRATNRAANGGLTVLVVEEGNIVKTREIKAKNTFDDQWIVEDGLNEGELIIFEGFQKISDGTKIKPVLEPALEQVLKN